MNIDACQLEFDWSKTQFIIDFIHNSVCVQRSWCPYGVIRPEVVAHVMETIALREQYFDWRLSASFLERRKEIGKSTRG